jgi:hypothetical protein
MGGIEFDPLSRGRLFGIRYIVVALSPYKAKAVIILKIGFNC